MVLIIVANSRPIYITDIFLYGVGSLAYQELLKTRGCINVTIF